MKPCAFAGQSLSSHIEGCLAVFKSFAEKNENYFEVASRRLRSALKDTTVPPERLEEIARLAILFHDVGKAYNKFQARFDDNCSQVKEGGFQYHEVASAAMCYKFLNSQGDAWSMIEKALLALSILNHHHASRNSIKMMSERESDAKAKVLKLVESGFCEGDLQPVFGRFNINLRGLVLRGSDVESFHSWLNGLRQAQKAGRWMKLYILVMYPLIVADNLEARRRGGMNEMRKMFVKEIEEVVFC
ncbi:MAG: CRISPR-associated endonuclease Cas3'' [Candidatus Jordarchaeales archaeon]